MLGGLFGQKEGKTLESSDDQKINISLETEFSTGRTIGTFSSTNANRTENGDDIAIGIANRIRNLFQSDGSDWIDEYTKEISDGNYEKAFDHLNQKVVFLNGTVSPATYEAILKLNYLDLPKEKQLRFLMMAIAIGERNHFFSRIEELINLCLNQFSQELETEMLENLMLAKAEAFQEKKSYLGASQVLQDIVKGDFSSSAKAFAYKQLSWFAQTDEDKTACLECAHDLFLESGNRKEAVQQLVSLFYLDSRKDPMLALQRINSALLLFGENNLDREAAASLYQKRAHIEYLLKNFSQSANDISKAIELREGLIGNEAARYSSYRFAEAVYRVLGQVEESKKHAESAVKTRLLIKDESFLLQADLEEAFEKKNLETTPLKEQVLAKGNSVQKIAYLTMLALTSNQPFEYKLELLDEATKSLPEDDSDRSLVSSAIARIYLDHGDQANATLWYERAMNENIFDSSAFQNYIALLWKEDRWAEVEAAAKKRLDSFGYSPGIGYALGRAYLGQRKYQEAYKAFFRCKEGLNFPINDDIAKCVANIDELPISDTSDLAPRIPISIEKIRAVLTETVESISSLSRMSLWTKEKGDKDHKWVSRPENTCKQLLIQGLCGRLDRHNVEIIDEVVAGPGLIDLYILFDNGTKLVIELKMCGGGYSTEYAVSGTDQLLTYLKAKKTNFGFLIIFDGRIRDTLKGFSPVHVIDKSTIFTIAADMSPKVKKGKA